MEYIIVNRRERREEKKEKEEEGGGGTEVKLSICFLVPLKLFAKVLANIIEMSLTPSKFSKYPLFP